MNESTMDELKARQQQEITDFINKCPHNQIVVEDTKDGFHGRDITIRCSICRLNLVGYVVDGTQSYLSYVRDCVKSYPGNCRETDPPYQTKENKESERV